MKHRNIQKKLKNPIFFIAFGITWLLLESPAIVGYVLFFLTKKVEFSVMATAWICLTAPPLPIPVIPISITVGFIAIGIRKRKTKPKILKAKKGVLHSKPKHGVQPK